MTDNYYKCCLLCPRHCGVNRLQGQKGYCRESAELRVAVAVLHNGEEPPLIGKCGSGTIFISGCNLRCVFCQNHQVSQGTGSGAIGKAVTITEFADICLKQQAAGAENINIVTGAHAIPAIIEGLTNAKDKGLKIPILWNSSAYESPEALDLLKNHVDFFLPDLKSLDSNIMSKFSNAPDYPQTAATAILKMIDLIASRYEKTTERIIIRHLVLPGYLESTHSVLRWFAEHAKGHALLSVMTQYTPVKTGNREQLTREAPGRYLQKTEYETVLGWLDEYNIEDGFCQELVTGSDWLPDFTRENPFPSKLSVPVWSHTY